MDVGDRLPSALLEAEVYDRAGQPIRLGELVRGRPVVLDFLRHYGCAGCCDHVTRTSPRLLELHELGVKTIFVGSGRPDELEGFVARHGLDDKKVTLVTDPSLATYRAAGLRRSAWAAFGLRSVVGALRALARGHAPQGVMGDALQQGGAFVVDAGGRVIWAHRSATPYDAPDASDLVDQAFKLLASRGEERIV